VHVAGLTMMACRSGHGVLAAFVRRAGTEKVRIGVLRETERDVHERLRWGHHRWAWQRTATRRIGALVVEASMPAGHSALSGGDGQVGDVGAG
jgi:hypothetical protein